MLLNIAVCIATLATYSTALYHESGQEDIAFSQDLANISDADRVKRATSLTAKGALALRQLLTGAKLIPGTRRYFYKEGDYVTALQDFYSVNPQRVAVGIKLLYGEVGDRVLTLNKKGLGGRPSIYIRDMTGKRDNPHTRFTDRISYVKPMKE